MVSLPGQDQALQARAPGIPERQALLRRHFELLIDKGLGQGELAAERRIQAAKPTLRTTASWPSLPPTVCAAAAAE
jgi:predicted secreted Zn-dependent protease